MFESVIIDPTMQTYFLINHRLSSDIHNMDQTYKIYTNNMYMYVYIYIILYKKKHIKLLAGDYVI